MNRRSLILGLSTIALTGFAARADSLRAPVFSYISRSTSKLANARDAKLRRAKWTFLCGRA